MLVYQIITNDKYELPIAQEDSLLALSKFIGRPIESVKRTIKDGSTIMSKKYRVIVVEIDED